MEAELKHLQFKHPCTVFVSGPTGSGKTVLVRSILTNHKLTFHGINNDILKVAYFYGKYNPDFNKPVGNVQFKYVENVPQDEEDYKNSDVVIFDDLMEEIGKSKLVLDLFTKGSHHDNLTVILITQNLYHKVPILLSCGVNAQYKILYKNPSDMMQVMTLARQVKPYDSKILIDAYESATIDGHGYLLCDFRQDTPENLRFRTNIVPDARTDFELRPIAFVKK